MKFKWSLLLIRNQYKLLFISPNESCLFQIQMYIVYIQQRACLQESLEIPHSPPSYLFLNLTTTTIFVITLSISNVSLCQKMTEIDFAYTLPSTIFLLTTCGSSLFHSRAPLCLLQARHMVFLCVSTNIHTIGKPSQLLINY